MELILSSDSQYSYWQIFILGQGSTFQSENIWEIGVCHMSRNTEALINQLLVFIIFSKSLKHLRLNKTKTFNNLPWTQNIQCQTKCYEYFSNRMKVYCSSLDIHYILISTSFHTARIFLTAWYQKIQFTPNRKWNW